MFQSISKDYLKGVSREEENTDLDIDLVRSVQSGNVSAFDVLVKRHRKRLYSVIYNMTSNAEDAADLTQDTFVKAFSAISKFKGKSAFYTWLYRIGVNMTIAHLKKNRLRQFFSFEKISEEGAHDEILSQLSTVKGNKSLLMKELQEKLNESLLKLSVNHRTVVVLHEIEGLSLVEIAQVLNISEGTIRSRLHHAKVKLQKILTPYLTN